MIDDLFPANIKVCEEHLPYVISKIRSRLDYIDYIKSTTKDGITLQSIEKETHEYYDRYNRYKEMPDDDIMNIMSWFNLLSTIDYFLNKVVKFYLEYNLLNVDIYHIWHRKKIISEL